MTQELNPSAEVTPTVPSSPWGHDLTAGLVVFLVALPLCLGIALASGAPLFSGLLAGIIGGLIVGAVSGSHSSVSGPAAGLTAIVAAQITALGSFEAFLLAVFIGGLLHGFTECLGACSQRLPPVKSLGCHFTGIVDPHQAGDVFLLFG